MTSEVTAQEIVKKSRYPNGYNTKNFEACNEVFAQYSAEKVTQPSVAPHSIFKEPLNSNRLSHQLTATYDSSNEGPL
jgi:hypothetical protein